MHLLLLLFYLQIKLFSMGSGVLMPPLFLLQFLLHPFYAIIPLLLDRLALLEQCFRLVRTLLVLHHLLLDYQIFSVQLLHLFL
jgi:hypothetical protein